MAEPNRSELYAVQDPPLTTVNGSNGHHPVPQSGAEETFVFPASREQTRYWMLAQLDPSSTASNMAISFDIEGPLNVKAAESAIAALTMRHEALRTLFRLEGGVLSQVVLDRPLYRFTIEDLSAVPAAEQDAAAAAAVDLHGHTQIDLHAGPVLHARLIHLSEQRHIMALTMNHIVCDGWSNGILIRDFTILYEAMAARREPVLPDLPFQFADFSLWQNEYLESPAAAEASAFWKSHITSDLPALDMPTDFPRTSGRSFPGHIESALLPKEIDDRLKEYCRKSGSTKHIVLLAAFEALCARYTGQVEFLLGSTIANRTQPGMEDVVGRFANPQIIVAKVDGNPTFGELEQRVRDWETAAYNHQDLPFSRIIEDFQIDQAGATSQFLQVWFLYQKAFMQPQTGETIRVTPRRSLSGGVDFDVLVSIVERAEGPRIQMEYNTELFKPERIRGLIASFTQLLGEGLADPSKSLSELAAAPVTIIGAVAEVSPELPALAATSLSLLDRVHAFAANTPDEVAVADEKQALAWAQLDGRSSTVAAELLHKGVHSAATVAVYLGPQVESAIALLAALKSGANVLPLPAHATASSIAALLGKAQGTLLLAPAALGASLSFEAFAGLRAAEFSSAPTGSLLLLNDAATASLSTFAFADVLRSVDAAIESSGLQSGESLLIFPADNPMDACLDLVLALASGSQASFARELQTQPIESQISQHQVTRLVLSASNLKALAIANWQGDRRVALLLRGGRLPVALTAQPPSLLPRNTRSALYLLSSLPAGGYAAYQWLTPHAGAPGLLPLGDAALSIKGPDGRPLPAGAFGELHAADGTALGYMARTSTTASMELLDACERFLPLRGHRICLGDIEDALYTLPQLSDARAAVTEVETAPQLVAYLVAASGADKNAAAVRQHLSAVLPSHLVPSDYIWLDKLPRMLDGRFDVKHLPVAEAPVAAPSAIDCSAQLTAIEEKLTSIWKDVLGLRQVDIHKPFFEMGGSSLLLVRLFARINKAFDTSLPITTIFDAKTIAELAIALGGSTEISPLVQVQAQGTRPPLFMIHSYLLYKGLSTSLGPDQPFYGLRELDRDGHLTIEERVKRYVQEIRKVQPQGPYHLAGWCAAGPLTVEVGRQLLYANQEVNYLALFDSWLPGYLESIEVNGQDKGWLPFKTVSSKLAFHRSKMRGLTTTKKTRYLWLATTRLFNEAKNGIYLRNWERLRKLSDKYHFALPQFMHNTSLDTFSALKDYREQQLPLRLTLIRASDSREITGAAPSCGWERVAEQGVDVLWAPGDHETMFSGENLRVTASIVARGLAESVPSSAGALATDLQSSSIRGAALHVDCPST